MPKKKKMVTLERRAVGRFRWTAREEARIERNLVALNGRTWEALRFCKRKNGRHNRVHLVIEAENFPALFEDAVRNGVFSAETLARLRRTPDTGSDPFLAVIGIGTNGDLAQNIDEELYGKEPA
jgi:hypothetical protein